MNKCPVCGKELVVIPCVSEFFGEIKASYCTNCYVFYFLDHFQELINKQQNNKYLIEPDKGTVKDLILSKVIHDIRDERQEQDEKWGEQNHSDLKWLSILGEEFGEVCKEVTEDNPAKERIKSSLDCQKDLKKELIQTCAVCVAWLEAIERRQQ
jgi:hypothetical protein